MCYSLWYNAPTMLPAGGRPATSWGHYTTRCNTQSSALEDGQNNCPKHFELIGIINKPLLLHLVGCLYYLKNCTFKTVYEQQKFRPDTFFFWYKLVLSPPLGILYCVQYEALCEVHTYTFVNWCHRLQTLDRFFVLRHLPFPPKRYSVIQTHNLLYMASYTK